MARTSLGADVDDLANLAGGNRQVDEAPRGCDRQLGAGPAALRAKSRAPLERVAARGR